MDRTKFEALLGPFLKKGEIDALSELCRDQVPAEQGYQDTIDIIRSAPDPGACIEKMIGPLDPSDDIVGLKEAAGRWAP